MTLKQTSKGHQSYYNSSWDMNVPKFVSVNPIVTMTFPSKPLTLEKRSPKRDHQISRIHHLGNMDYLKFHGDLSNKLYITSNALYNIRRTIANSSLWWKNRGMKYPVEILFAGVKYSVRLCLLYYLVACSTKDQWFTCIRSIRWRLACSSFLCLHSSSLALCWSLCSLLI